MPEKNYFARKPETRKSKTKFLAKCQKNPILPENQKNKNQISGKMPEKPYFARKPEKQKPNFWLRFSPQKTSPLSFTFFHNHTGNHIAPAVQKGYNGRFFVAKYE